MRRRHRQTAIAGSIHFITAVTAQRGNWFTEPELCENVLQLFEGYRAKHNLTCFGYVLMPDHLHSLLLQSDDGDQVSRAVGGFKQMVSIKSRPTDYLEGRFWREGYDDVLVPGRDAAMTKLRYMHDNPVRRGLATCAEDYRWSSAPWYYEKGESVVALEQLPFPAGNRCA